MKDLHTSLNPERAGLMLSALLLVISFFIMAWADALATGLGIWFVASGVVQALATVGTLLIYFFIKFADRQAKISWLKLFGFTLILGLVFLVEELRFGILNRVIGGNSEAAITTMGDDIDVPGDYKMVEFDKDGNIVKVTSIIE